MDNNYLIEKHLQNKLSSDEKLVFENLLKKDANFKKEVVFHSNLKKAIKQEDATNFRNFISNLEENVDIKNSKKPFFKWFAAASVVILLGLSYLLIPKQAVSTNVLFATYFEPYRNVVTPIVRGTNDQDEKTLAFIAYEKGEYKTAVFLFSKLYTETKEPYYLFYKANALLKLERAKEAIPLLLHHLKTKDTLTAKTNWYLALAYLKTKEKQKAKTRLKKVISTNAYHHKEAKELLKKID